MLRVAESPTHAQWYQLSPLGGSPSIETVDQGLEMSLEEGLLLEANHFGLLASTADMREGMQAFLEKRKANFTGD